MSFLSLPNRRVTGGNFQWMGDLGSKTNIKKPKDRLDTRGVSTMLPAFVVEGLQNFRFGRTGQLILHFHKGTIGSIDIK